MSSNQIRKLKTQAQSNSTSFNTERESKGVHPSKMLEQKQKASQRRSSFSQDTSFSKKESEAGLIEERQTQSESNLDEIDEPPAPAPVLGNAVPILGGAARPHGSKSSNTSRMMKGILDQKKPPLILTSKPAYSQIHKKREKGEGQGEDGMEQ